MYRTPCLALAVLASTAAAVAAPPSDFFWLDDYPNVDCSSGVDNTTPLQDALDDLAAQGGTLVLPNGQTCEYKGSLAVTDGAGFVIEGNGATLENTGADGTDPEGGIVFTDSHDFEVRNLVIRGAYSPAPASTCEGNALIRLVDVHDAVFRNVRVTNGHHDGFYSRSPATTPAESRTRNLQFLGCSAEANCRYGFYLAQADNAQLIGGRSVGNLGTGTASVPGSSGVRLEPNSNVSGEDPFAISRILIRGMTIADNSGAGIHLGTGGEDGSNLTEIRIVDNLISSTSTTDLRYGALRIAGGRDVLVRGNEIVGYASAEQTAVAYVAYKADRVTLDGNRFHNLTAEEHVIFVQDPATGSPSNSVVITGNQFADIDPSSTEDDLMVIFHKNDDAVIADNQMINIATRAIEVRGKRAAVRGNVLKEMKGNVVVLASEDAVFADNSIHVETAGTSANADAVVYSESTSVDNLVRANSLFCTGTTQKGFYFSQTLQVFTDNSVDDCASPGWHSGQATLAVLNVDNLRY